MGAKTKLFTGFLAVGIFFALFLAVFGLLVFLNLYLGSFTPPLVAFIISLIGTIAIIIARYWRQRIPKAEEVMDNTDIATNETIKPDSSMQPQIENQLVEEEYTGIVRHLERENSDLVYRFILERYDEETREHIESIPVYLIFENSEDVQIDNGDVVQLSGKWMNDNNNFFATKLYNHTRKVTINLKDASAV